MRISLHIVAASTLLLAAACVSEVELAGAPCPCPDGYACCETLSACVADPADCPDEFPPSSETPCETDADCPRTEACHAWSSGGVAMGPGECRVMCAEEYPCAAGEICEMTLHDGAPMEDLVADRLCLSEAALPGCEEKRCDGCGGRDPGVAFCDGTEITGCFFSLHPACGLACEATPMEQCSPGICVDGDTPYCDPEPGVDGNACDWFNCAACEETYGVNGAGCEENTVVTCWSMPSYDPACDRLCWQTYEECPEGTYCEESDGPVCVD